MAARHLAHHHLVRPGTGGDDGVDALDLRATS
jgi:hypothetical protein